MSGSSAKMTAAQQRQEFCVRWNSHLGSIGAAFPQLLAGQRFVDVTLACEGHQVHCHRLVLAACSSYFESILAENPCKHPVIILPSEIKLWEIQALVDFMYKGEVNVTLAGLPNLLRCAEQLRIRGLYGSDAALNLNQLKALTNKVSATATANLISATSSSANNTNDSTETDNDSATTTTTNNTIAASTAPNNMHDEIVTMKTQMNQQHLQYPHQQQQQHQNGTLAISQRQLLLQQQQQSSMHQINVMLKQETNASNATEDDSADESASNAYENDEEYSQKPCHLIEATAEEDGSFDDSFGGVDAEQNNYMMQKLADGSSAYKRIRRSEDSLAQAAKCVSKGQTFQTVSNMFNIPVSTIRFYMARKGILPKRKRGRGACATGASTVPTSNLSRAEMSHNLSQIKHPDSPTLDASYNMVGYKLQEETAANMM